MNQTMTDKNNSNVANALTAGSNMNFLQTPGTISLPLAGTDLEGYCLAASVVFMATVLIGQHKLRYGWKTKADKLTSGIYGWSEKKRHIAMEILHSEFLKVTDKVSLSREKEMQTPMYVIPKLCEYYHEINVVLHTTSDCDEIDFRYPPIFDESKPSVHLHFQKLTRQKAHISIIRFVPAYKAKNGWNCIMCHKVR